MIYGKYKISREIAAGKPDKPMVKRVVCQKSKQWKSTVFESEKPTSSYKVIDLYL